MTGDVGSIKSLSIISQYSLSLSLSFTSGLNLYRLLTSRHVEDEPRVGDDVYEGLPGLLVIDLDGRCHLVLGTNHVGSEHHREVFDRHLVLILVLRHLLQELAQEPNYVVVRLL